MIRRKDFTDDSQFRFDKNGGVFRHMVAFVPKICKEFFDDCQGSVYLEA